MDFHVQNIHMMLNASEILSAWNMLASHEMFVQLLLACFEKDKSWMKEKRRLTVDTESMIPKMTWHARKCFSIFVCLTRVGIIIVFYIRPKTLTFDIITLTEWVNVTIFGMWATSRTSFFFHCLITSTAVKSYSRVIYCCSFCVYRQ